MATYCFRCTECGWEGSSTSRDLPAHQCSGGATVVRNYRAENVGVSVAELKREREHSKDEYAAQFLPTADDYKSPSDPDGTKGLRDWADTHTPAESNKRPVYPAGIPKRSW